MRSRGAVWFERITGDVARVPSLPASVMAADVACDGVETRVLAVVPDPHGRYPRARSGEVGIDEGHGIARAVRETPASSSILAIVDVPGQAFGRREEDEGLHAALARAVEAYAVKRRTGTRIAALVVGKAISGAFLAHGMQAGWIGALRDPRIEVHVMSETATARVTRMEPDRIARLAGEIPATSRDIEQFASFGAIDALFDVRDPDDPSDEECKRVLLAVGTALSDPHLGLRNPLARLNARTARASRALARDVRDRLDRAWDA
jgi:biotin-independent malonate decarboxylase gamma subunit